MAGYKTVLMIPGRSVIIGLVAGAAVYGGLLGLGHMVGSNQQTEPGLITNTVTPVLTPGAKNIGGAKIGANFGVTTVTPVLTPGVTVPKSVPTVMAPVLTPRISLISTPIPYTTLTPTPSPIPSKTPTPTPSPTYAPTPTVTASLMPTATATPEPTQAQTPAGNAHVVINEIAWMGTEASQYGEWLELYNYGTATAILDGWAVYKGDAVLIYLSGSIEAGGYYLIERTTDTSPDPTTIAADVMGKFGGSLKNLPGGEDLFLRDAGGIVVDSIPCSGGWFAGDNSSKASMERISASGSGSEAGSWATFSGSQGIGSDAKGNPILGTPRTANSVAL